MSSLKICDLDELSKDQNIAPHFSNFCHILKLCQDKHNIPPVSSAVAASLLTRLKKNVSDLYSITVLHYSNAGQEGIDHFQCLLNNIITEVKMLLSRSSTLPMESSYTKATIKRKQAIERIAL